MSPYYPRQETEVLPSVPLETSGETPGATGTDIIGGLTSLTNELTETPILTETPPLTTETTTGISEPGLLTTTSSETTFSSTETVTSLPTTTTPATSTTSSTSTTSYSSVSTSAQVTSTTPTSSSSESSTTSLTTVTTEIDGRLTTFTSSIPTSLIQSNASRGDDSTRTGLIAGLTTGLIVFLCFFLGAIFAYRRHRRRRKAEVQIAAEKKRREQRSLLDGEGFDDDHDETYGFAMREYDGGDPRPVSTQPYSHDRAISPSLLRSRAASETGSIFREDVWPPPADELIDPIMKTSSQVDLSRVVDDVMGPSHTRNDTDTTMASTSSLIMANNHSTSREPSLNSQYMDGSQGSPSAGSLRPTSTSFPSFTSAAALASSSSLPIQGLGPLVPPPPVLTTNITSSPISLHRPTSPNAARPYSPESPSSSTSGSPLDSGRLSPSSRAPPSPTFSIKPQRLSSSIPKKSSPLARRLSQDARTWLTRTPAGASHSKNATS